jgi:hypothetical protein
MTRKDALIQKGIICKKNVMYHNYGIYFKTTVSKHAKQTNVKQQENTASPKSNT